MKLKLTADLTTSLPPGEYSDQAAPGLTLRVSTAGARVFAVRYRVRGRANPRRYVLEASNLADARRQAAEALLKVRAGVDPLDEAEDRRRRDKLSSNTLEALCRRFLEERTDIRPATRAQWTSILRAELAPALGRRDPLALTRPEVRAWSRAIAHSGRGPWANRCHEFLRRVFSWAVSPSWDTRCRALPLRGSMTERRASLKCAPRSTSGPHTSRPSPPSRRRARSRRGQDSGASRSVLYRAVSSELSDLALSLRNEADARGDDEGISTVDRFLWLIPPSDDSRRREFELLIGELQKAGCNTESVAGIIRSSWDAALDHLQPRIRARQKRLWRVRQRALARLLDAVADLIELTQGPYSRPLFADPAALERTCEAVASQVEHEATVAGPPPSNPRGGPAKAWKYRAASGCGGGARARAGVLRAAGDLEARAG